MVERWTVVIYIMSVGGNKDISLFCKRGRKRRVSKYKFLVFESHAQMIEIHAI